MNSPTPKLYDTISAKQYKTPNVAKTISHFSTNCLSFSPGVKETLADRFIPLRTCANLYERFLAEESPTESKKRAPELINAGDTKEKTYKALLKANMMTEDVKSNVEETKYTGSVLTFKKEEGKIDPLIDFDYNPIKKLGQGILFANDPYTHPKLPQSPYKILDAPGLKDDFYLNIIDWSATDVLAVGLGKTLYTLKRNLSEVGLALETSEEITAISFNSNGNYLLIGYNDGLSQLMDIETSQFISSYSGHNASVTCASWCNNFLFSTGSRDKVILDRDTRVPAPFIRSHEGHRQQVCGLKWSPDGRVLASGGNDDKVLLWDIQHTTPVLTLSNHCAAIKALAWSPINANILATGGGIIDKCIKIWDYVDDKCLHSVDTESQVCNMVFSKDGKELVSTHGFMSNTISLWTSNNLAKITTIPAHDKRVLYLAISPNGESIVTGAGDETLKFWRLFPQSNKSKDEYESSLTLSCLELR